MSVLNSESKCSGKSNICYFERQCLFVHQKIVGFKIVWQKATPLHSWYIKLCVQYQKNSLGKCNRLCLLWELQDGRWNSEVVGVESYLDNLGWNVFTSLAIWSRWISSDLSLCTKILSRELCFRISSHLASHPPVWCWW